MLVLRLCLYCYRDYTAVTAPALLVLDTALPRARLASIPEATGLLLGAQVAVSAASKGMESVPASGSLMAWCRLWDALTLPPKGEAYEALGAQHRQLILPETYKAPKSLSLPLFPSKESPFSVSLSMPASRVYLAPMAQRLAAISTPSLSDRVGAQATEDIKREIKTFEPSMWFGAEVTAGTKEQRIKRHLAREKRDNIRFLRHEGMAKQHQATAEEEARRAASGVALKRAITLIQKLAKMSDKEKAKAAKQRQSRGMVPLAKRRQASNGKRK
ncbi:hypothetical protein KIPB_003767, partial [Kipferlia bialata]|eukprot:g3767.t1